MANFNPNSWYQLTLAKGTEQSLTGTSLYDHGTGATFFQLTNTAAPAQQWQLFPYNSSYYVLRSKGSGPNGYMNVKIYSGAQMAGNTVPYMASAALSDQSVFWTISPWDDGTFYLTNAANGTSWHLNVKEDSLMTMSSNITAPQEGQRFAFTQLGGIDDDRFSSALMSSSTTIPTSSATAAEISSDLSTTSTSFSVVASTTSDQSSMSTAFVLATSTTSSLHTSIPSSTSSASEGSGGPAASEGSKGSGLSTGAKVAIGASIGILALLIAIILGLFLLRRRRRIVTQPRELDVGSMSQEFNQKSYFPPQYFAEPIPRYEMEVPPGEMASNEYRPELPAPSVRY